MVTGAVPSPPRYVPLFLVAHRVQHSHAAGRFSESRGGESMLTTSIMTTLPHIMADGNTGGSCRQMELDCCRATAVVESVTSVEEH